MFKKTTGKKFLALVPYAHLLGHRRGAGGNTTCAVTCTGSGSFTCESMRVEGAAVAPRADSLRLQSVSDLIAGWLSDGTTARGGRRAEERVVV